MVRLVLLVGLLAVVLTLALYTFVRFGPDLSMYKSLTEPRITTLEDQKMLVVQAVGDPNVVGAKAFGKLFEVYYQIKDAPKGPNQPAPRARWSQSLDAPPNEWVGRYALPVPSSIETLPPQEPAAGLQVQLTVWQYGEVAEILHIGPYSSEGPTVEKLKRFISDRGYKIIDDQEEEYLRRPGLFGVSPGDYYTIIRYRITKSQSNVQ